MPMRQIVDTHAHICDPVFDEDRGEVLQRAGDVGITAVIAVGEDLSMLGKILNLLQIIRCCARRPGCIR